MPTVKLPQGGTIAPAPLQGGMLSGSVPQGAFDNGAGSGMAQLGKVASDITEQWFERDAKTAARETFVNFSRDALKIDGELRAKKLTDANGVMDMGQQAITKLAADYRGKLGNSRQQELFDTLASSRIEHYLTSWSGHQQGELEQADKLSSKAIVADGYNFGVENHSDWTALNEAKNKIEIGVAGYMKGADQEAVKVETATQVSKMLRGAIEARKINDAVGAMSMYQAAKGAIHGDDREAIERTLKSDVDLQSGQATGDNAYAQFGDDSGSAADWISKNVDGAARERAMSAYSQRVSMAEHAESKKRSDESANISLAILNAKTPQEANAAISAATDPHVKLIASKLAADRFAVEKPKAEFSPENVAKSAQLRSLIDNGEPLEIEGSGGNKPITLPLNSAANVAMAASAMGLDNAHRGDLLKYFEDGGIAGKIKAEDVNRSFKLYTDKKPEDAAEAYDYVLSEVKRVLVSQGKEPTQDTVNSAVKQALLTFRSSSKPAYPGTTLTVGRSRGDEKLSYYAEKFGATEQEVNRRIKDSGSQISAPAQDAWIRTWQIDIPQSFRSKAEKLLRDNGKQVNETTIRMLYIRAPGGDFKGPKVPSQPLESSMIKSESSGDQGAISAKGAVGKTQLMEGTAKDLKVNRKDEFENVAGGVKYLSDHRKKYADDAVALVAYNMGPGAADEWLKAGGSVSSLPAETRAYVRSVLKNSDSWKSEKAKEFLR